VKDIQIRFSDFRIFLPLAPSHPELIEGQWLVASFVPDYSGGSVPDFPHEHRGHGVPSIWIPPILFQNLSNKSNFFCQVFHSFTWDVKGESKSTVSFSTLAELVSVSVQNLKKDAAIVNPDPEMNSDDRTDAMMMAKDYDEQRNF